MTARPSRDFAELLMQRNAFKKQLPQNAAELRQAKRRRSASSQKDPMDAHCIFHFPGTVIGARDALRPC